MLAITKYGLCSAAPKGNKKSQPTESRLADNIAQQSHPHRNFDRNE